MPADFDRIYEGTGEAGGSKNPGSKSGSATWDEDFVEDEKVEFDGVGELGSSRGRASKSDSVPQPVKFDGIGEEVVSKPRTESVARSARSRRPKAKPSPAAAQSPGGGLASKLLSIGAAVIAFSCLFGLIVYLASEPDVEDQDSQPPGLSKDCASPGINDIGDWIKENGFWGPKNLGEPEGGVETVDHIQPWDEVPIPKASACVCPQCPPAPAPAPADPIVCANNQEHGIARARDLFPSLLAPTMAHLPALQNYTNQLLDEGYDFVSDHPWLFLLGLTFATWKGTELLVLAFKMAKRYTYKLTDRFDRTVHEYIVREFIQESLCFIIYSTKKRDAAGIDRSADENSERARKEAEETVSARTDSMKEEEGEVKKEAEVEVKVEGSGVSE
jgi:hypothetical protein